MDFIDVCRVCLKNSVEYIDLHTPFEQDTTDNANNQECGDTQLKPFTYLDCFKMCTRLEIVESYDGDINGLSVPQSLCDTCGIEMRITYDFIQKAKRAHEILQEAMLKTKVEINENEWEIEYESAQQNLNEEFKNEQNSTNDDYPGLKDDDDKTHERLLHTQQTEDEIELVNIAASITSTFDPLSLLQEQDKKVVGAVAKVNEKHSVIKTLVEPKQSDCTIKKAPKDNPIKTTPTQPRVQDGPNEGAPKQKHNKKNMFLCHACPLIYRNSLAFHQHTLAHEGKRERKLACKQCKNKFFNQTALQQHIKIHDTNRLPTFHCDKCDKSFFHSGSLNLHKQYHSEQRIECGICGKRYVRQSELIIHLRTHTGDLPYKCSKCDRAFAKVDRLNRHVRSYHEGHRYKCNVCKKEYMHQSSLGEHYKQHTGLPLKCSICDRGFPKMSKMHLHLKVAHKVMNTEEMDQFIVKIETEKQYLRIKGITSIRPVLGEKL